MRGNERITVRLSSTDMSGLKKIQTSGGFDEMSSALRWCIHFAITMLKLIPPALIESYITPESENNDSLEIPADPPSLAAKE